MNLLKKEIFYLSVDENISLWKKVLNNKLYRILLGILSGALVGLLYWNFIGCNGGSCPLTSNPYQTTLFGGLIGGVFANDNKEKKNNTK